jgi:hypothetical protein
MKYLGPSMYGMDAPLWVSGATIPQWQSVTSPADGEVYRRIAATGGGTTDPADDMTNYVAVSYERTSALQDGQLLSAGNISNTGRGVTQTALPAIGTSTRTSILSVTGRGCIDYFAFLKAAGGTSRVEIICDGRTILDQSATYTSSVALLAIGQPGINGDATVLLSTAVLDPKGVEFRRNLQVYLTNITTASTTAAGIAYHLRSRA